jgi:hypothetical protein
VWSELKSPAISIANFSTICQLAAASCNRMQNAMLCGCGAGVNVTYAAVVAKISLTSRPLPSTFRPAAVANSQLKSIPYQER